MARAVCGTDGRSRTCKQQPVIIHTILVDMGDIGAQLREKWFSVFLGSLKNAVDLLSPEESATLRNDRKWIKELRSLTVCGLFGHTHSPQALARSLAFIH